MNKTFHSVWNASKKAYVAAAETISAKGKPSSGVKTAATLSALFGGLLSLSAHAQTAPPPNTLPTGGQVSAGQASISQSAANMVIQQSSNRAAINWQTFNLGKDAHVQFQQPSAASVTLNRVLSSDPSQIFGRISANGQVVLSNPAGVYFGKDARVDVGGLVATTHGMSDADFMAGKSRYERNGSTASVVNEGELKAALGGYIAMLAPEVRNQGAVIANMGTVALAAGEAIELRFDSNNRLTSLRVDPSQIAALVDNRHAVQAPGGLIIISAQSMDRLVGGVVKNSGRIEANGLQQIGGRIVLSASHKVDNTGSITANATQGATSAESGPAGKIEISAPQITNSGNISATGSSQHSAGSVLVQAMQFTQTDTGRIDLSAPTQGGALSVQATGNVQLQGSVNVQVTQDNTASGTATQGGQISIEAQGDIALNNAKLDASGGAGGHIQLRAKAPAQPDNPNPLPDAPGQGRLAIMGQSALSTRGRSSQGGNATLLGERIDLLENTSLDASGVRAGGHIRIGVSKVGENADMPAVVVLGLQTHLNAVAGAAANHEAAGSITVASSQAVVLDGRLTAPVIEVSTQNLIDAGQWDASAASTGSAQGGRISVYASGSVQQTQSATWTVDGTGEAQAGSARIEAGTSAWLSGHISAQGLQGGQIAITAPTLVVAGAQLNANGQNGGGRIRVGGGWQGQNADLANASKTTVISSSLQANAQASGNGGEVVVWSDTLTQFGGDIQARGGSSSGNGGQVEVSSHGVLQYAGQVDVKATQGQNGRLLLDPKNIEILASANGISTLSLIGDVASRQMGAGKVGELMNGATSMGTVYVANHNDSTVVSNGGSFHLFNSTTGALITRITGVTINDSVGSSVTPLSNGNLVIRSSIVSGVTGDRFGLITWINGSTGQLADGTKATQISDVNSLSQSGLSRFSGAVVTPLANGHFVFTYTYSAVAGTYAIAWGNGSTGRFADGTLGKNSSFSQVAINTGGDTSVTPLPNGNYVMVTPSYGQYSTGAVTWSEGTGLPRQPGIDSLMGTFYSNVGSGGITVLNNGHYVVSSPNFDPSNSYAYDGKGAVTWLNGWQPITNNMVVSSSNSLVGGYIGDKLGSGGITALANSNYVVSSPLYSGGRGAVNWGNGATGTTGWADSSNSLMGVDTTDAVGFGGITALANGHYVVSSPDWGGRKGAATWLSGTSAINGMTISDTNSLVGVQTTDKVSSGGITALANGQYVVSSPSAGIQFVSSSPGAITWGNGNSGISGVVSTANSLFGNTDFAQIGSGGVIALTNGNYVVLSPGWYVGADPTNTNLGAVTLVNGSVPITGYVSATNSLVGSTKNDYVGERGAVTALSNGNYVVASSRWDNGAIANAGAVTWVNGMTGLAGALTSTNSLVGNAGDMVGSGGVKALKDGTYVVLSPSYTNGTLAGAGAATWGMSTGTLGAVTTTNSLIGTSASDGLGSGGAQVMSDGRALVISPNWDQVTPTAITNAGRVDIFKYMNLTTPSTLGFADNASGTSLLAAPTLVGFLNAGTNVSLQASNDITVSAALSSNPASINSGSLNLQAGRSVLLNASIALKNANITITGNDWVSNGVVNAQRDTGNAVITQAVGTSLNAGTGTIALTLRGNDSVTKTYQSTGNITLRSVSGGSVSVLNQGATANSGVTYESIAVTNDLSLQANTAINLSTFSLSGKLSINSGNGTITQSGALTVGGTTTLTAGTGSITLTNVGNDFTGAVSVVSASGLTLLDSNNLSLGEVSVAGPISVTAGGDIAVLGHLSGTLSGSSLLLKAAGNISQSGVNASTNGGSITYWTDSDGAGGGAIAVSDATIDSGSADIVMGGGSAGSGTPTGFAQGNVGLSLTNTELIGRDITLRGLSNRTGTAGGVGVQLIDTTMTLGVRNVTIEGLGAANTGSAGGNVGVALNAGAWLYSSGNVAITGTGGGSASTGGGNHGVQLDGATIDASKSSGAGTVTITGTGGGGSTGTDNDGVLVNHGAWVRAHSGTVTLVGTAGANADSTGLAFAGGAGQTSTAGTVVTLPNLVGASKDLINGNVFEQTGAVVLRADSMAFDSSGKTELRTTGALTLEPLGNSFSGTSFELLPMGLTLGNSITGLTVGKASNTTDIVLNAPFTVAGPIGVYGGNISSQALTATGSTLTLQGTGNVALNGDVTASSMRLLGGNVAFNGSNNTIGTLAASGVGSLSLVNSGALTIGTVGGTNGVSASGAVSIATKTGDLTVAQNISTTDTSASALVLNAGKDTSAGTNTGGNVVLSGNPTFTLGSGARATFYTGSVSGSTGLTALVGSGSGRFRYNSDESSSGYDATNAALGTGLYAVYREQPTLSVTASNVSAQYANTPVYALSLSGGANGDTAAQALSGVTYAADGALSSSNHLVAGSHTITASGGSSLLGYAVNSSYATGTLTVTPKALTVSGTQVASKDYDGTSHATLSGGVLGGIVGADAVTAVDAGSFNSSHAAASVNVTASYTLNGSDSGNYTVTQPTGLSGTIHPKAITATAAIGGTLTKVYDGTTQAPSANVSGDVAGAVAGDTLNLDVSGYTLAYNSPRVLGASSIGVSGTADFTIASSSAGSLSTDYMLTQPTIAPASASITPATLTASLTNTGVTRDYNGTLNAPTGFTPSWSISGFVTGDTATTLTHTSAAYDSKDAGIASKVTVSGVGVGVVTGNKGSQASDYQMASVSNDVAATITAKAVTISGLTAANKVYDGRADVVNVTNWGAVATGVGSETLTLVHDVATLGSANAGTQTVTATGYSLANGSSGGLASNYMLTSTQATSTITIDKAPLKVQANNDAKFVTTADMPGFTGVSYSGYVNGETASVITGSATVSRSNASVNDAGNYSSVLVPDVSGLSATNYSFVPVNGNFTIVPSNQLLVRVNAANTVYGSAAAYSIASAEYFNNGAAVGLTGITANGSNSFTVADVATGSATFTLTPTDMTNTGAGKTPVGAWQLGTTGPANTTSGVNFSNTLTVVGTHAVTAKPLTASAGTVTKVYDGTTSANSVNMNLSSKETGDTVTANGLGNFNSRNVGQNLNFSVSGITLQGSDAANYFLQSGTTFTGNTGEITRKVVTLTPQAATRVYDGSTTYTASATDLAHLSNQLGVAGDTVSDITLVFADKNVATGKTLTATAATIADGNNGGNYALTLATNSTSRITRLSSVTWTGGNSGNWFDPANWTGGAVPDLANVANVVIPSGVTVSFDKTGAQSPVDTSGVVSLDSLGTQGSLTQANGTLNIGSGGMVLGAYTQSGGTLNNAGTTTLGSFTQSAGSFTGTGGMNIGNLTQTGGTLVASADLTVTNGFSQGTTGSISVGGNVSITDTSGGTVLGNLRTGGDLVVNSTDGAITQAAGTVIATDGSSTFTASSGGLPSDIRLDDDNDFKGPVNADGQNITLKDVNDITLGNINAGGDLIVDAGGDVIQDKTPPNKIVVAGLADITAGGDVILDGDDNDFKGTVNIKANDITIKDKNDLTLGDVQAGGGLIVDVGGDVIQDKTPPYKIVVNGKTDITSGGSVVLDGPYNKFTKGVTVKARSYKISGDDRKSAGEAASVAQSMVPVNTLPGTGLSSANAPQPLVMSSSAANSSGVTVDMKSTSQQDTPTMVAVSLPKGASTVGAGFSFELPESVRSLASDGVPVQASRVDGTPLPTWLKFDRATLRFEANAVPDSALPMQVTMVIGGQRLLVVISERTE